MSSKVIATPAAVAAAVAFLFIGYLYVRIDAFPTGAEVGILEIDVISAKIKSGARQFLETGARAVTPPSPGPSPPACSFRLFLDPHVDSSGDKYTRRCASSLAGFPSPSFGPTR